MAGKGRGVWARGRLPEPSPQPKPFTWQLSRLKRIYLESALKERNLKNLDIHLIRGVTGGLDYVWTEDGKNVLTLVMNKRLGPEKG